MQMQTRLRQSGGFLRIWTLETLMARASDNLLQIRPFCDAIVIGDGKRRPAISARSIALRHSFNQRLTDTVIAMGILNTVGEIAGAVAAVDAAEKVDSDAGLLTKGIAAVAGFEGAKKLEELAEKKEDAGDAPAPDADSDSSASQA
jgi:hypothetical protein